MLIGPTHDQFTSTAWTQVYRGLNHNYAKSQFQQHRNSLSTAGQTFTNLFCDLQIQRHNADYNPHETFTIQEAETWLNKAEAAITDFLQTSRSERAAIAILTLVRTR